MAKGKREEAKLVSIYEASTFLGFCGYHDDVTFAPLEKSNAFISSFEQCGLIGFRSSAMELYRKQVNRKIFMELLPSCPTEWQKQEMNASLKETIQACEYISKTHKYFEAAVRTSRYEHLKYYSLLFKRTPTVMTSVGFYPLYDFHGKELCPISRLAADPDGITIAIIATAAGGAAVFVWHDEKYGSCSELVKSLHSLPDEQKSDALIRLAYEFSENTFCSPIWWNALESLDQQSLIRRSSHGTRLDHEPQCLMADGYHFDDWEVIGFLTNLSLCT